jgi:hypothetical protein
MSSKKFNSCSIKLQNKKSAENAQDIEENDKKLEVKWMLYKKKSFKCMKWLSKKFSPFIKCFQCVRKKVSCEMPSVMAGGLHSDNEKKNRNLILKIKKVKMKE